MDVTRLDVYRNAPLNARGRRVFRRTLRVGMRQMKREIVTALAPFQGKSFKEVSQNEVCDALMKYLDEKYPEPEIVVVGRNAIDPCKLSITFERSPTP